MARKFFYVRAGLLCLALAYHLGAKSGSAQMGSTVAGFAAHPGAPYESAGAFYVLTSNGDVFARYMAPGGETHAIAYYGKFWAGTGPTPAKQESWGQLKTRYR